MYWTTIPTSNKKGAGLKAGPNPTISAVILAQHVFSGIFRASPRFWIEVDPGTKWAPFVSISNADADYPLDYRFAGTDTENLWGLSSDAVPEFIETPSGKIERFTDWAQVGHYVKYGKILTFAVITSGASDKSFPKSDAKIYNFIRNWCGKYGYIEHDGNQVIRARYHHRYQTINGDGSGGGGSSSIVDNSSIITSWAPYLDAHEFYTSRPGNFAGGLQQHIIRKYNGSSTKGLDVWIGTLEGEGRSGNATFSTYPLQPNAAGDRLVGAPGSIARRIVFDTTTVHLFPLSYGWEEYPADGPNISIVTGGLYDHIYYKHFLIILPWDIKK